MNYNTILGKNIIFFWILNCIFFITNSQNAFSNNHGSPYIQRIILQNYGIENNNFSLVQTKEKLIYIGNSNGVIQLDGKNNILIKIQGVKSLTLGTDNKIYIGALNQFGIIAIDSYGHLIFKSLIDSSFIDPLSLGQIKKVFTYKNDIVFCSETAIYRWSGNKIDILKDGKLPVDLFKANNIIYSYIQDEGLRRLLGDEFEQLPNSLFFANKRIIDIFPFGNNQLLVLTKDSNSFYLIDNMTVTPFLTEANEFISLNNYKSGSLLNDGTLALATRFAGIIIIDKNGKIVNHINETQGLLSENVNFLYQDEENNLWALHNSGLSRIEYPSAYCYYHTNAGIKGAVNDIIEFNNTIYVATSIGVYSQIKENVQNFNSVSHKVFASINGINSAGLAFHKFDNNLFVTTVLGIFEIIDDKSILRYKNTSQNLSVLNPKNHPNYLLLATNTGLSAVRYGNKSFLKIGKLNSIDFPINSIAEDIDGSIWFAGDKNDIYCIYSFTEFSPEIIYDYFPITQSKQNELDWARLISINEGVLFSTSVGLYRFDKQNSTYYLDTLLGLDFLNKFAFAYPIAEDNKTELFINVVDKLTLQNKSFRIKRSVDEKLMVSPLAINRLNDFLITLIKADSNGTVWFGGINELIKYNPDLDYNYKDSLSLFFTRIIVGTDSVIYNLSEILFSGNPTTDNKPQKISYSKNSIQFNFSSTDFVSEKGLCFQYKLDGIDENWSEWELTNQKVYKDLHEGKYTFRVKAKNVFDVESPEISYLFIIKPPFYRTTLAYIIYLIFLTFIGLILIKWRAYHFARERFKLENIINERTEEVVIQKEKADNLLERVLPKTTATELKSGKKAGPYHYNMVTVLFSDIQGFTKISEQLDSEMLIDELDKFFMKFDSVVDKYNIEKIKTIGDAYMCAGGIPEKNRTNPVEVVLAAIEMQNYMKTLKHEKGDGTKRIWDLRIGIDTGPVVAGVLGRNKITYDIWGGTVNTASRMEAAGEPGKVNITENTYMLIKEFFICQYRGKMPVKYKGELDMYFVESFMPHLANDIKGLYPNENFFTQLQLLRLNDIEEFVLTKLETGLPKNLFYHNIKHTIDVVTQVELIGRSEKISDEDMLLLKTAALFHDMGHLIDYDTHEEESVKLARKILPAYHYNEKQIEQIARLILCTQMPPEPKDLLEEIMCDADLDYLGRTDFVPVSVNLFKELRERSKIDSLHEWNNLQIKFIQGHQYFTQTARKLREVNKNKQLDIIRTEIRKALEAEDEY